MKMPLRPLVVSALSGFLLAVAPAALHAQATKIFVASFGNDANDGSRGSPKRSFQPAHDAVAASGQIVVLDTAGYGALAITKAVSITVPPGVNGFIAVTGNANAITINAAATDTVALRGLIVEGGGAAANNGKGIVVNSVGALFVQDCTVRDFNVGLNCFLTTTAQLNLDNTEVRNCGEGIDVANKFGNGTAATAITASVNGCRIRQNSGAGINAIGQNGSVDMTVADCFIAGNNTGILSQTPGGTSTCVVRVDNCRITGNASKGVGINNTGQLLSRGNNTLEKNPNGNAFPATYSAK